MDINQRWSTSKTIILYGLFLLIPFFGLLLHTETAHAASYSPYDVEKTVKDQRWDTHGENNYLSNSGKRLHYDVYSGSSTGNKKGYNIEKKDFGKGKESFLTFTGWSAIFGYTHHSSKNQSTYIMAVNKKDKTEKMYRLQPTSIDVSKDVEYNRTSSTGKINNLCKSGSYNKESSTCNMEYKSVGFKAWIPLSDLFPDENKPGEWVLYIVKRVGTGSKLNVVYDQLITPFEFEGKTFQKGLITLSSGINAKKLTMLTSDAIRRTTARGTAGSGSYFTKGTVYTAKNHSEKYPMVWHGVISPKDNDKTRYAPSLYWRSQGDPAVINYDVSGKTCPDGSKVSKGETCTVDVTIKHVDVDTNALLKSEKVKSKVGADYSYKPKKNGNFVNGNGWPYNASPTGQKFSGKTGNSNMSFTFTYRAKPDTSETDENVKIELIKSGQDPKSTGYFLWELRRAQSDKPSQLFIDSKFNISSSHYAIRNAKLSVMGPGISKTNESAISFLTEASSLKDKKLSYDYKYEYTNYYRNYYVKEWYWVNGDPGRWDWYWKFDRTETAWDKGEIFSLDGEVDESLEIKVDHNQNDKFDLEEMKELEDVSLVVGKRQNWDNNKRTLNKTYYEQFSKPSSSNAKTENILHTQTFFKMEPDKVNYKIELPSEENKKTSFSPLLKQGSSGLYYSTDIDESIQDQYKVSESNNANQPSNSGQGDTIYVTGQTSANYDKDGYKGTLTPYLYDVIKTDGEKKYVTNQSSAAYNLGGFTGTLSPYVASGTYTPSSSKNVSSTASGSFSCSWTHNGNSFAEDGGWNIYLPSSVSYYSDGYSGTLTQTGSDHVSCSTVYPRYEAEEGSHAGATVGATGYYSGTVYKPSSDTRTWKFQGNVYKNGTETQETRYQGYVTKEAESSDEDSNESSDLGDYAFPLQMKKLKNTGLNGTNSTFELEFVTDYFFMSKDLGYVGYYPYAERVKANLASGKALPSQEEILNSVTKTTSESFKKQTKENFEDTFLYVEHTDDYGLYGSTEKLQRFWLPMDASSSLENGVEYNNAIQLDNMGLSDASFTFIQKFSFDLYLMGSIHDEVATWEQVEPRNSDVKYDYSITLTPDQQKEIMKIKRNSYALHGFRFVDTKRIYSELKSIINVGFGDFW